MAKRPYHGIFTPLLYFEFTTTANFYSLDVFSAQETTPPPVAKKRKTSPSENADQADGDQYDWHILSEAEEVLHALRFMNAAKPGNFQDTWQAWGQEIYNGELQAFVQNQNDWIDVLSRRATTFTKKLEVDGRKAKQLLSQLKDILAKFEEGGEDSGSKEDLEKDDLDRDVDGEELKEEDLDIEEVEEVDDKDRDIEGVDEETDNE
jgi:hypothetical protein